MRFAAGNPQGRFIIKHVPVPEGGFIVADTIDRPQRVLIADEGGVKFWSTKMPHSHYYETRAEAEAVAAWLTERAAGYPWNRLMWEWPRSLALSDLEGATWDARTVRAEAYDWTMGSSGQTD